MSPPSLGVEPNRLGEGFRAALFHRTEGHPLFTVELLCAMKERGDLYVVATVQQIPERVLLRRLSLELERRHRAELYRGRGLSYRMVGEFEWACTDHEMVLQMAHAADKDQIAWRALLDLGQLWTSRDYNRTRDCFESALELARRLDESALLAGSLNCLGNWHVNAENPLAAVTYHQEALEIVEPLDDRWELLNTLDFLGIAELDRLYDLGWRALPVG